MDPLLRSKSSIILLVYQKYKERDVRRRKREERKRRFHVYQVVYISEMKHVSL